MIEREIMIKDLITIYPYPESWFKKLKTPQLMAMYSKIKKRPITMNIVKAKSSARRKYEDGDHWVLTDMRGWEIETN